MTTVIEAPDCKANAPAAPLPKISAVLLAAGASRRFGASNKLLAPVEGTPIVRRVTDVLRRAGFTEIVAVTGYEADAAQDAIGAEGVTFVHNADWDRGMGTSIAAGVTQISATTDGVIIVPGDMAFLNQTLLTYLIAAFADSAGKDIVVPVTADGTQVAPVIWPRRFVSKLTKLPPDRGGKHIIAAQRRHRRDVPVINAHVIQDIDTQTDYDHALEEVVATP